MEKAIYFLNQKKFFYQPERFGIKQIARLIRPSGYYRQKAVRIKNFLKSLQKDFQGKIELLLARPAKELRNYLLSLSGIGPETADSIILYAARKPALVIDAYTRRILKRVFGWKLAETADYEKWQKACCRYLNKSVAGYGEFHALMVRLAKEFCRKIPRCPECFLRRMCKYAARQ